MDYCRRREKVIFLYLAILLNFSVYANTFYNSLVDDLLNACSYGYKGINLETGEIDFSNNTESEDYIIVSSDTSFYIPSCKGFFLVSNDNNEFFYTRNGEFIQRGKEYFLAFTNYKLVTEIKKSEYNPDLIKTMIYHPTTSSKIIRNGYLFSFSEVECFEEEIISNRLELPNIDSIQILLKMKYILNKSPQEYYMQLEILDRLLDNLIYDKMHEYYIRRSYSQFDLEKYQLANNQTNLDQLQFLYSTNWARTFSKYIKMLYITINE